jgi:hypothetical protein
MPQALCREPEEYEIFVPRLKLPTDIIWEDARCKSLETIDTDKLVVTSYSEMYPDKPTPESGQEIVNSFRADGRFIQLDIWIMLNLIHTEIQIECRRMRWVDGKEIPWTYNRGTFTDSLVDNIPYGCSWNGILDFNTIGTIFKYKDMPYCFWTGLDADCRCFAPQPLYDNIKNITARSKIAMLKA